VTFSISIPDTGEWKLPREYCFMFASPFMDQSNCSMKIE
jgi:hypothetical protein